MIHWPMLKLPPINLYTMPRQIIIKTKSTRKTYE
jgi:hypothetical protein